MKKNRFEKAVPHYSGLAEAAISAALPEAGRWEEGSAGAAPAMPKGWF